MLYKGSIHGFKGKDFHNRCDHKGPTISFILSEKGYLFGGYVSVSWDHKINGGKSDPNAFIFSIKN